MEVLLFALFFISALIFFIAGKDDFGRTENKLTTKEEETVKEKVEAKVAEKQNMPPQEETVKNKEEAKVAEKQNMPPQEETVKDKEEAKVAEKQNMPPQEGIKKDS